MKYVVAQIWKNKAITPYIYNIYEMQVKFPGDCTMPRPGQFAMLYLEDGELMLPRPISISNANENSLTFVYQVVGDGTRKMTSLPLGEPIRVLAPLGKGFHLGENARTPQKKVCIIGGGIGVAPLVFLAKTLHIQGVELDIYLGFRKKPILIDEFEKYGNVHIATESGDAGHHGRVLDIFSNENYDEIMACGPTPLLHAVAELSHKTGIPAQVSVEERMACGLGTCVGCALKVDGLYQKICTEGPVFYSDQL